MQVNHARFSSRSPSAHAMSGFAVTAYGGKLRSVEFDAGDSVETAMEKLRSINADPESIVALSGVRGVAKTKKREPNPADAALAKRIRKEYLRHDVRHLQTGRFIPAAEDTVPGADSKTNTETVVPWRHGGASLFR
jgi:hypothetical protein